MWNEKEYKRKYYQKNKKKLSIQSKKYRKDHRERLIRYSHKYYQNNKEKFKEWGRLRRLRFPEKVRDGHKRWREKNPDKVKALSKRQQLSPIGRIYSYQSHAKRKGIKWSLTRQQFKSFWNLPCFYCGEIVDGVRLDRLDNSRGYYFKNVVACCKRCNNMKCNLSWKEFIKICKVISERF